MELLLAIQRDGAVREIRLEADTAAALTATFSELGGSYITGKEIVPYEPTYQPEKEEVMVLEYELPEPLRSIRRHLPDSVQPLTSAELEEAPPKALVAVRTGNAPKFWFQAISSRNLLLPRRAILSGAKHFQFNKSTGIIPAHRLDAVYEGGKLFFRSEHQVRQFLDLEKYFREATDEDLRTFFGSTSFVVENWDELESLAGTTVRRKLARLVDENVAIKPLQLRAAAKRTGLPLEFSKGAIVVPTSRRGLRDFVDLMSHSYVTSVVDPNLLFYASSKRPLARN